MTFAYEKAQSIWTLYYILCHQLCFKLLLLHTFNPKYSFQGLSLGPSHLGSNIKHYSLLPPHFSPTYTWASHATLLPLTKLFLYWMKCFNHSSFPHCITICWGITLKYPSLLRSQSYRQDRSQATGKKSWRRIHGNVERWLWWHYLLRQSR